MRHRALLLSLAAMLVISLAPPTALADEAGQLDPTFGQGGIASVAVNGDSAGRDVAIDAQGRIVAVGSTEGLDRNALVARFLSSGSLDSAFRSGGVWTSESVGFDDAKSVVVADDSSITFTGAFSIVGVGFGHRITRLTNTRRSSRSYTDGTVTSALAIDSAGRILLAGSEALTNGRRRALVTRRLADLSRDTSFSGTGEATMSMGGNDLRASDVAIDIDGNLVVVGNATDGAGLSQGLAWRLLQDASDDLSFGEPTLALTARGRSSINSLAISRAGRIVVVGTDETAVGDRPIVIVLDSNGDFDTAWAGDGILAVDAPVALGAEAFANDVIVDDVGRVVVVGTVESSRGAYDFAVWRFLPDGTPDPEFGDGGVAVTDVDGGEDRARGVAIDADGNIVVVGVGMRNGARSLVVARYLGGSDDRFIDDDGSIFEDDIEAIADAGITLGCNPEGTLFCPDDLVTRGQMAAFLSRAQVGEAIDPGDPFTDDDGSMFEEAIEVIFARGITRGCNPEGTLFCPDDLVTRGQMAAFLNRAFDLTPVDADHFADDDGSIFELDIEAIRAQGITLGCNPEGTLFCPDDFVTRGQMAAFLNRALTVFP